MFAATRAARQNIQSGQILVTIPRSLTKSEQLYYITQRKWLAILWTVLILRPYLEENRFIIQTNHDCLKWILNLVGATDRFASSHPAVYEFEVDVVYRDGIKRQRADALSRMPTEGADTRPIEGRPIRVIDTTSKTKDETTLLLVCCRANAHVVEDNDDLQKGAWSA